MSSENNNVWQLPEPETTSFTGDEIPMYFNQTGDDEPLSKRSKSSSSSQTASQQLRLNNELPASLSQYNPLNEPSPLGLRLRKSPSLLELAQKRLNQCSSDKGDLPSENLEARTKRDSKAKTRARVSSSIDKLKASHFPALLLRIGQWEYVSKHEGDLVAKCYFSKHKIVWEVLDGGLKKKFEINWADIMGLKANCAADGLGTLTIVLDKPPLFFKEINPQPRKHTQWRAASDFTDGEASIHRQHLLQCAQGVLDKHYEKLIQCDARLNFLSQQQDIVLNFPYFPPKPSIKDQEISGNSGFNLQEIYNIAHMASASTLPTSSSEIVEPGSRSLIHQDMCKEAHSTSSVMSMDIEGQQDITQSIPPHLQPNMSISDIVNYIGNSFSEQNISGNLPYANNADGQDNQNDMLENISQILLSDNQLAADSDERIIMSRVDSFCNLLQDYQIGQKTGNESSTPDHNIIMQQDRNDSSTPDYILISKSTTQEQGSVCHSTKLSQDYANDRSTPGSSQMAQQDGNENSNLESNPTPENDTQHDGIARNDSFSDLVHQLPRITSLPRFLFDISENGEILK